MAKTTVSKRRLLLLREQAALECASAAHDHGYRKGLTFDAIANAISSYASLTELLVADCGYSRSTAEADVAANVRKMCVHATIGAVARAFEEGGGHVARAFVDAALADPASAFTAQEQNALLVECDRLIRTKEG